MYFEVVSEIRDIEIIAAGKSIRDLQRLRQAYGPGRWRKPKGTGSDRLAELHWYEAHGIGGRRIKVKRFLD